MTKKRDGALWMPMKPLALIVDEGEHSVASEGVVHVQIPVGEVNAMAVEGTSRGFSRPHVRGFLVMFLQSVRGAGSISRGVPVVVRGVGHWRRRWNHAE